MIALVSGHPHPSKRKADFDAGNPCRYCVESPQFRQRFTDVTDLQLFRIVVGYAGAQRGGTLGQEDILLPDRNGELHLFRFETFFNGHEALTLGYGLRPKTSSARTRALISE
jgi:hypothetical protein